MEVDDVVRQIDEALSETNTLDNTIVILTSDNGSFMYRIDDDEPDHQEDWKVVGFHPDTHESNGPWRGTKADIYEAGHHLPMLVRWPGKVVSGTLCDRTVSLTDWYATFAEIVGHSVKNDECEDCFSMLALLKNPTNEWSRPPVIHHSSRGMFAIRDGEWKLIAGNGSGGRQKPAGAPFKKPYQLFNLKLDPGEREKLDRPAPGNRRATGQRFRSNAIVGSKFIGGNNPTLDTLQLPSKMTSASGFTFIYL